MPFRMALAFVFVNGHRLFIACRGTDSQNVMYRHLSLLPTSINRFLRIGVWPEHLNSGGIASMQCGMLDRLGFMIETPGGVDCRHDQANIIDMPSSRGWQCRGAP